MIRVQDLKPQKYQLANIQQSPSNHMRRNFIISLLSINQSYMELRYLCTDTILVERGLTTSSENLLSSSSWSGMGRVGTGTAAVLRGPPSSLQFTHGMVKSETRNFFFLQSTSPTPGGVVCSFHLFISGSN